MDIIKNKVKDKIYLPKNLLPLLNDKKYCFFDIETTGLSKKKDAIILAGILYPKDDFINITQFFTNTLNDEYELLNCMKDLMSNFDYYITYNGYTFDIPFINSRFKHHNIDFNLSNKRNIDVLKFVRRHKELLNLSNCKLKSVEKLLNISREDKISGKDSVELYLKYVKNNDIKLKNVILKHNYDDIYNLSKILKIYDLVHQSGSLNLKANYNKFDIVFHIDFTNPKIEENMIYIFGNSTKHPLHDIIYYDSNFVFKWIPEQGNIKIKLQVNNGMLSDGSNCYYIDKNDYDFKISFSDNTKYQIPENFILLRVNKVFIIDNLKNIVKELILNIL